MAIYSYSYFLPLILRGSFGYSLEKSYILNFPPYALAAIVSQSCFSLRILSVAKSLTLFRYQWMLVVGYYGDKYKIRGPIVLAQALIIILGVCLTAFLNNGAARYFGVFLGVSAINSNIPAILSYQHNNISEYRTLYPPWERFAHHRGLSTTRQSDMR